MDNSYAEFNELANTDDGSCQNIIDTDIEAFNYNEQAIKMTVLVWQLLMVV